VIGYRQDARFRHSEYHKVLVRLTETIIGTKYAIQWRLKSQ